MAGSTSELDKTIDLRTLRSYRALGNLFFHDQIDLKALPLPEIVERPPDEPDVAVAKRLSAAFRAAVEGGAGQGDGIWERISAQHHQQFIRAMLEGRDEEVAAALTGMFRSRLMYGMSSPVDDFHSRLRLLDAIVSLGVSAGILPARSPASLKTRPLLHEDPQEILSAYADLIGYDLAPPQCGGIYGVRFRDSVVPIRHIFQVQQAERLRMLLGDEGCAKGCLEIGGGAGFLAYATMKLGVARRYCIIDLPQVNVLQGYFMLKSDLAPLVRLFGEESPSDDEAVIQIYPDFHVHGFADDAFDIGVNVDSLPEMDGATIRTYVDAIARICERYFLSNNKEVPIQDAGGFAHGWIHRVLRGDGRFRLESRAPWWMREGYVEEVYRIRA